MKVQNFFLNFAPLTDAPNAVPKLRELVLQLALQGKLVTQNRLEESASQLSENIEAEKIRLAEEHGLKAPATVNVEGEEAPYVLPNGWVWSRLANIGLINPRNDFDDNAAASFVPMSLVPQKFGDPVKTDIRLWGEIRKGFTHFAENDVVLAKITPCFQNGKAAVMRSLRNRVGAGTTELHVFRPINGFICPEYVLIYLKSPKFLSEGITRMTGTAGQKRVPSDYFALNPFPLPPLEEQKRIVDKVDELMRLCDVLEERQQAKRESRVRLHHAVLTPINKAASLTQEEFEQATIRLVDNFDTLYDSVDSVPKLRSTILQLAVHGKLGTENPNDEPASVLLDKTFEQRQRNQVSQRRTKVTADGIGPNVTPFRLPSKWVWTRLGPLTEIVEYGTSEKAFSNPMGIPVFRMNNIEAGRVLHSNLKYVSPTIKDLPRLFLKTDDLLFNRTNSYELVGKTGIFKGETDQFTFASYLIRIRLVESLICPDYVNLAMNADYFRATQINSQVTQQCGQANFNGTKLANALIPLPPLEEQKRIVAKVDQLMLLCNEFETELREAEAHREKLMSTAVQHVLQAITYGEGFHDIEIFHS